MEQIEAKGIKSIEIESMWGRKHIFWELRPDINILSGVNGAGKSTILNRAVMKLDYLSGQSADDIEGVNILFDPPQATNVRYDVIRCVDRPLLHSNLLEKMADRNVISELDWQIYKLQRRYLDYQVNIGNRTIQLLTSSDAKRMQQAMAVSEKRTQFMDYMDELFLETGKRIIRDSNEILFEQSGERLMPYSLSSGEKQLLVIMLTLLVQDMQPCVLFMDEPEVSLHIEWQHRLISAVRFMNPNAQIILTTHSPAMIMDGWMDVVTEVDDITLK